MKFKSYLDLVYQAFSQFNENLINNQDPHSQIENDETPGAEYPNESDSVEGETNNSALLNLIPQILPNDEIPEGVNSRNPKQREVFNVVHTWVKDYVKNDGHNVVQIHTFLSGSGGTGKSHLPKVIYNVISKILLRHCKDPEKPRVLFIGSTGISAVNIGGTIIHSGLRIKPGIKLLGLNDKSKTL